MGVGWGEVRPGGLPPVPLSPDPGLGSGVELGSPPARPGLECRGPEWGAARPSSHPALGAQQGTSLQLGQGSRLRPLRTAPSPMARPRHLPPRGQRSPRPPGRLPPAPPPRAMEPSRPGGQGGAGRQGRPTDRRTDGPQRRRLPPALRRLGGAGPAGAPARAPAVPASSAPARAARRSDACPCRRPNAAQAGGDSKAGNPGEAQGIGQVPPRAWLRSDRQEGADWPTPLSGGHRAWRWARL